ncbi:MAG: LL-diaminopimelate aminotransferase [Bacillota bacterium]|nr:LL-diaminopimelate aminotransferase [Bacillota bacterium]
MREARRLERVPPYFFAEMDKIKASLRRNGVDLIDLGVGDPDSPTPEPVVRELCRQAPVPANHRYPAYEGSVELRQAICRYYMSRFGVKLDPEREAIGLIGSKEGLSHLVWAFVDPGDCVLVPDPAYPVYAVQTLLAGGSPYHMPLLQESDFLPDFDAIPRDVLSRAKLMFLNYPNNPTSAVCSLDFFRKAVEFAHEHGVLICHDAAYVEMSYDGFVAPSILQVDGASEVAVETYSWSKPFNMTGWRVGAMLGSVRAISALRIIKTNTDSGQFTAVQMAAVEALRAEPSAFITAMNVMYSKRRDVLIRGLQRAGLDPFVPQGTFYVWCPVPVGDDSTSFSALLLKEAHVIVAPGSAYGARGEGYVRFALTADEERLEEAASRIGSILASRMRDRARGETREQPRPY